jgi:radical SAM superfamily enzyme YgiQ (UPF0313 family)
MRFRRVLLVSPPTTSYLGAAKPPQNLGYLSQALDDRGILHDVLDMRFGSGFDHLSCRIRAFSPDLVGFSVVSLGYARTYALMERTKAAFPDKTIVAGGPHVTVLGEQVLRECQAVDFGVVHEGEEILVELCDQARDLASIRGLIWRDGEILRTNASREPTRDLDSIAFPRYRRFNLNAYIRERPLNSSRGCPYQCVFCPNKMITKRYRVRSATHVVDEIGYWYGQGIRIFNFDDDNFSLQPERVFAICDEIERRGFSGAEFRCSNGLRADRIDVPLLKRMKSVGFHYIAFGLDGGNDRMLTWNRKGETLAQIEDAVRNACEIGFDVKVFCIVGMPHETAADVEDSIRLVRKYPVQRALLNNPVPYPGTELYETVEKNGWFLIPPSMYLNTVTENTTAPVFATPELDRETRVRLLKKCRRVEREVGLRAIRRQYPRNVLARWMLEVLWITGVGEQLFFKNRRIRQWVENFRFHRMRKTRPTVQGIA